MGSETDAAPSTMTEEVAPTNTETMLDAPLSWAEQLELLPKRPRFDSEPIRATETFQEPVRNFSDLLEGESKPLITASWPDPVGKEPLEADMTDVIRRHFSAEKLPKANILRNRMQRETAGSMTQVAHAGGGIESIPSWPGVSSVTPHAAENENVITKNARSQKITIIDDEPDVEPTSAAVVQFPKTPTVEGALSNLSGNSSFRTQAASLLFVLSVPLVVTAMLWQFGEGVKSSPEFVRSFFSLVQAPPAALPPSGVEVAGLRSEMLTLDDGHQVLDITGQVVNGTSVDLSDVTLEASLFSSENQPLGTLQVAAQTGLQPSQHINALPERTITELQKQQALGANVVKSNSELPFRIIVTENTDRAAWFTARVYSVRPQITNS